MGAATFSALDNELPWNSTVGVTPGSGGSTLPSRTFASVFFPAPLDTNVVKSASLSRVHNGVGAQSVVATSEIGNAVFVGSMMQPVVVPGSGQLPCTHRGLAAPVESKTTSLGSGLPPVVTGAGVALRRETQSA